MKEFRVTYSFDGETIFTHAFESSNITTALTEATKFVTQEGEFADLVGFSLLDLSVKEGK